MNWLNINLKTLDSAVYIDCEPSQRGTWLSLLGFCCKHENGGIIKNCKEWSSRKWLQLCGVTEEDVKSECGLFHFDDDGNLFVYDYPLAQQNEVKIKSISGKLCGRGGLNKAEFAKLKSQLTLTELAELSAEQIAELRHSKQLSYDVREKEIEKKSNPNKKVTQNKPEELADVAAANFSPTEEGGFWEGVEYGSVKKTSIKSYEEIHLIGDPILAAMSVTGDYSSGMYGFLVNGCNELKKAGLHSETIKNSLYQEIEKFFGQIKSLELCNAYSYTKIFVSRIKSLISNVTTSAFAA